MIVSRAGGVICVVSWTDLAVGRVGLNRSSPPTAKKLHRNKRGDREKEEESNKKEKRKRAG
jgi:hypothetical protein